MVRAERQPYSQLALADMITLFPGQTDRYCCPLLGNHLKAASMHGQPLTLPLTAACSCMSTASWSVLSPLYSADPSHAALLQIALGAACGWGAAKWLASRSAKPGWHPSNPTHSTHQLAQARCCA